MAELMKGETWADACKLVRGVPRFQYPIIVEVKADEIRCRVYRAHGGGIEFESYAGKPLHNLESFAPFFKLLFNDKRIDELDVGVLVNGNFNDSYRWVRSSKGWPLEKLDKKTGKIAPALTADMVQFIVFDLPGDPRPFDLRLPDIDFACQGLVHYGLRATRPVRNIAHNEQQALAWYAKYREMDFEGAMGKTLDHLYERRRTFGWMKIKPKMDFDGVVTGINEAFSEAGEPLGRAGSLTVRMADGSTAQPAGIPHGLGRLIWENQAEYMGQWVEAECMERDRKGGYRHPVFDRFREDK